MDIVLYNKYSSDCDLNNKDNILHFVSWVNINGILYNTKNMSVIINVIIAIINAYDENNDLA